MIIKSLTLENIRSYKNCIIDFSLGTTLFEGDIGSGKSSILMAIEFALFGLSSEKGVSLLRTNEKKGSVTLTIDIEGKSYEIFRSLVEKKQGKIHQAKGYIKTDDGVMDLSTSEMKVKILDILNFNEPTNPRAHSVIYRYAVFTPQEEMKKILWMKSADRLQTFRKILGIENYRIAINNCTKLIREIKRKKERFDTLSEDLDEKKVDYKEKLVEEKTKKSQLEKDELQEKEIQKEKEELTEQIEKLQKEKDDLAKIIGANPQLEKRIEREKNTLGKRKEAIQKHQKEITEKINPELQILEKLKSPTTKEEQELKDEKVALEKKLKKFEANISRINSKIKDYESIKETQKCPMCDRKADIKEYQDKIDQLKKEEKGANKKKSEIQKKIEQSTRLIEDIREYNKKIEGKKGFQKRKEDEEKQIETSENETKELEELIKQLTNQYKKNLEVNKKYDEIMKKITERKIEEKAKVKEYTKISKQNAAAKQALTDLRKTIRDLKEEIAQKRKYRKDSKRLSEYIIWLENFLIQTLANIETHVFMTYNHEFNTHYQKWWNLLVDDVTKETRIDDNFTPIVEQDKYEQELPYLSGGEKTSLALAYRLALNNLLKGICLGLKSNLLILDEPTDGFSKEQLYKIREVLNEINCPQVIIVSHEKELESFADHIFKITKNNGISEIS
ncbi:MAG: AAA family ATPase [Candidatus Heimdallarchaeota archaeon]|nr:AAA family ATPase [Candidatus Heimdallarchaeota archaeon]